MEQALRQSEQSTPMELVKKLTKEKDLKAKVTGKLEGEVIQVETVEFQ